MGKRLTFGVLKVVSFLHVVLFLIYIFYHFNFIHSVHFPPENRIYLFLYEAEKS